MNLQPNIEYTLDIIYRGGYDEKFCELFLMEIEIQPVIPAYQVDFCTGKQAVFKSSPPLSNDYFRNVQL